MSQAEPSTTAPTVAADEDGIAVVVLTHDRVHLLRQCVENVLLRSSPATREIVIWDNASTDGTDEYLSSIEDPRVRVIQSEKNVGQNGYAQAFRLTSSPLMVELDDDVVDAPVDWDLSLRDAFLALPEVGFLAADLEDDPHDEASNVRHHVRPHLYTPDEVNGVQLLRGPTGGGCAMTSRALYERVGGFREHQNLVFWLEDEAYIQDIEALGFQAAVLASLQVHHTGGPYYSSPIKEKTEYWKRRNAARARRDRVKRILVKVPLLRRLNTRFKWFVAPS
jgi:GT2 family glycosyltransferase